MTQTGHAPTETRETCPVEGCGAFVFVSGSAEKRSVALAAHIAAVHVKGTKGGK